MKKKLGAITVGQAPRDDVTVDLWDILGPDIELLERGALDGLTKADIEAFKPEPGDYILVSRLKTGESVMFAEKYILPRLQSCIDDLVREGCEMIAFFCTGDFPCAFESPVPLIFPNEILHGIVPALAPNKQIVVITPSKEQVEQSQKKWQKLVKAAHVVPASPYVGLEEVAQVAGKLKGLDFDLIVLDCIGYTSEMKKCVCEASQKPAILSRTILARALRELME